MTSAPNRLSGIAEAVRRVLGALALFCFRRHLLVLAALAALAGVAGHSMGRLSLDPDVSELLPPSFESVQNVEKLREKFGGVGNVTLMVEGGTIETRRAFADAISEKLAEKESVWFVDHKVPVEFFRDRALYWMSKEDLETLRDRLDARRRWEIERGYLDLDEEAPPPVVVDDLIEKYRGGLTSKLGRSEGASSYHEDAEGQRLVVFVRPTELATDLSFSKRVVADVEDALTATPPTSFHPDMRVELTGRYKKRVDLQTVLGADLQKTSLLAGALVVLYVAFHFRRATAVLLVLAPLGLGVVLSYGLAGAVFGKLNILTAFIGAILVGITIDNGLHLLGRTLEEVRGGLSPEAAVHHAFGQAGRVSLAAALTTASAFGALTWTDFRAFREFGVLAASGMLLLFFAYATLLPALLGLFSRFTSILRAPPSGIRLPGVSFGARFASPVFWLFAVGALIVGARATDVRFNADFSKLDDADLPSFRLDREVNALLGRSQTPLVVLSENAATSAVVAETVRANQAALGENATIGLVATRADLLPEGQAGKRAVLDEIQRITRRFKSAKLDDATRRDLDQLEGMLAAQPFTEADLPTSLRFSFQTKDSSSTEFCLLFPTVSLGEAASIERVASQLERIELPSGERVAAAGEPMVLADILRTVKRDAPRILGLTLVLVLASLVLTLGRLRLALLAMAPALLTLVLTAGAAALVGLELNYLNMIVLPILLGIGVDDGAHLVARVDAGEPLEEVWSLTGWDITGAILTDVFGFGVLALASHPGLASLGWLALLGLTINFLACVVVLPAALAMAPLVGTAPRWTIAETLATSFGAGKSPVAPGTVGALLAIPIAFALAPASLPIRIAATVGVALIAIVATTRYLREGSRAKDPQEVVIDETAGCLLPLVVVPFQPAWVLAGFALFRLFDVWKPGPVRWADRKVGGGLGVVLDDQIAGAMAAAILLAATQFIG